MKVSVKEKEFFQSLMSRDIRAYLEAQGWKETDRIGDKAIVLYKDEALQEVLLPLRKDLGDYALRVSELVSILADMEERSQVSIVEDITKSGIDVIRIRLTDRAEDGTMPFSVTAEAIHNAREMLLAAACAAQQPRRSYGTRKSTEAMNYIERVRIGQTERGSYVLNLLSPVTPKLTHNPFLPGLDDFPADDPFERQTTRVLAKSLNSLKKATVQATAGDGFEVFENIVGCGVSANLCEAVSRITEKAGRTEISVTWARTRPHPKDIEKPKVIFERDTSDILAEAARTFRLNEPKTDQVVTGWVYQLTQDPSDPVGLVKVKALIEGKPRTVKVQFSLEDYPMAIRAHEQKKPISVEGDVVTREKTTELLSPKNLTLLSGDDE